MNAVLNDQRMPGFGDLSGDSRNPNSPDYDSTRDERIAKLAQQYAEDADTRSVAASWLAGEFSGDHYEAIDLTLFDLHGIEPSDLLNSPILPRLYELAKVVHARYAQWFQREAETEVDRQIEEGAEDAAEARMERAA